MVLNLGGDDVKKTKDERRTLIETTIQQNPFITDQALSDMFEVSIQTIRLDRSQLQIPELRERVKNVAKDQYQNISALEDQDIIGDIVSLEPNLSGKSIMTISKKMSLREMRLHVDMCCLHKRIHYVSRL